MSLLEGWIVESAMLGHAPSIGDFAMWAVAEGGSGRSSGARDPAATKPLERNRRLSVTINGKSVVLRGDLDRLPEPGEIVRMLAMLSYGSYQFTSQTRQRNGTTVIGGRAKQFVTWSGFPWPGAFDGLTPGSSEFSDKWRELVKSDESKFHEAEHTFTRVTHYDIQIQKIADSQHVDMRCHSHALNDVIWSTCVQHGPATDVVTTAMSTLRPPTETRDYDVKLIDAIYAERGRKDSHGNLVRFIHSSAAEQENVGKRFVSERVKAQRELANEKDY